MVSGLLATTGVSAFTPVGGASSANAAVPNMRARAVLPTQNRRVDFDVSG